LPVEKADAVSVVPRHRRGRRGAVAGDPRACDGLGCPGRRGGRIGEGGLFVMRDTHVAAHVLAVHHVVEAPLLGVLRIFEGDEGQGPPHYAGLVEVVVTLPGRWQGG